MPQRRAVPGLLQAALPTIQQRFPALLTLEHTATVPALPTRTGNGEGGKDRIVPRGWGTGREGHLPWARDAREAVPSLCVPHTHMARQAAAHQQHAITGQTLDVLWGHSRL